MESYYNALCGKYVLVALTERYSGVSRPQVLLSDTLRAARRGEKRSHFNKLLLDRIEEALVRGRQVMLFQNRRGFPRSSSAETAAGPPRVPIVT